MPPSAVGISRSFSARVMAPNETRPFAWSARIVEASALARASAAFLCACPLLILQLVLRPRRDSILPTEVQCQLPPRAVGIRLRFNSSASVRREMKPAAISPRMVEAKQRRGSLRPACSLRQWRFSSACATKSPHLLAPLGHHGRTLTCSARLRSVLKLCRGRDHGQKSGLSGDVCLLRSNDGR